MKQLATNYSFNAEAKTVTLTGLDVPLNYVLLIINATRNQIIYNLADTALGAETYEQGENSVITLKADLSGMANSDQLTIFYDDGKSGASEDKQGSLVNALGSKNDGATDAITGEWSLLSLVKGLFGQIFGKLPALNNGRVPVDIGGNGSITVTSGTITVSNEVEVKNGAGDPIPVSAESLPLPTGAATETTLAGINGKLPALSNSRVPVDVQSIVEVEIKNSEGDAVPISSGAITNIQVAVGAANNPPATNNTGSWNLIQLVKGLLGKFTTDESGQLSVVSTNTALGSPTDARATNPDTNSLSVVSLLRGIFKSIPSGLTVISRNGGTLQALATDPVKAISLSEITGTAPETSTEVLMANTGRNYLLIQNLSSAPFHISFGGAASTSSLRIDALGSIVFDSGVVASNSIRMIRTVVGQQYYIAYA